jgi:3-oxoacyl-[acyl-carrier protein] reductase
MGSLTGKTALVTGASRGIGRATALRLGADGALVGVHYGQDEAAAKQVVADIQAAGGRAFAVGARLGEPGDIDAVVAAFDAGIADYTDDLSIDILVNNAGILTLGAIDTLTEPDLDAMLAIHVTAPLFLIQRLLPRLRDGGRIINLSSVLTQLAAPHAVAYAATKGAVDAFTKALAKAVAARGITVNAVAPGVTDTDMNARLHDDPAAYAKAAARSPFGRIGQVDEVADVVAFVASDASRWITGGSFDVSGGSLLGAA